MFQNIADFTAKQLTKEKEQLLPTSEHPPFNSQRIWTILVEKV